jgi:Subtilase family/PASTA domain
MQTPSAHTRYWGPHTIQLAAPGTYIYSTNQVGSYSFGSGTSFSTPFVSGVAALLLSLPPDLDVVALKHALVGTYSQESTPYTGCPCGYQGGGAVEQLPAFDGLLSAGGRLDACRAIPGCGADFAVVVAPTGRSVTRGGSTSYTLTITPSNGFSGPVSLSESGLPGGAAASFSPNPATSSSMLSVTTTGATATGSFPVSITGTSGGLTHATTVTLEIQAPPPPAPPPTPVANAASAAVSCHVPAVKGKQLAIARRRIKKAHCAVGAIHHARSKKKRGLVIAQRPPAGRTLPKAARVNLVVSRGR